MEYQHSAENNQINKISNELGLDGEKLRKIMSLKVNENNIDEFGRFNELINTIKIEKAKTFLERKLGKELTIFDVNIKSSTLLRNFILQDGFDIDEYKIK